MNDYQFDPITGQPIQQPDINQVPQGSQPQGSETHGLQTQGSQPQAPEVQEPVPPMAPPTPDQPSYRYIPNQPQEPIYAPEPPQAEASYYQPQPAPQPPVKEKKPAKPLTRGALIPIVAITLVLAIGLGFAGGFIAAQLNQSKQGESVVIYESTKLVDEEGDEIEQPLSIEAVAATVENSVVEITTEQIVSGSFLQQYVSEGAGSGVIITADGYIVTNNHVIEGATNIKVRLKNESVYEAKLIGADAKTDLAIIKIEAKELTPAVLGSSSELKVGEEVVAVGNPLGQLGGTVTRGIISALDREIDIDNTTMRLLQTDTAINPGNSGGGLFNRSGQLIGVVNAKSAGAEIEGLGFAIPIDTAKSVVEDLIDFGYVKGRVSAGIVYLAIEDQMTAFMNNVTELGVYVYTVEQGSDAEKAGLMRGDLIVSIGGKEIKSVAAANSAFDAYKVGDSVTVAIKRAGKAMNVTLTLSEYAPKAEQPMQKPML